jgi:hypothetical protein
MSTDPKKSIKKIFLLALSTVIIGSSAVFGFSILGNVCSQVITNAVIYYNTMMTQKLNTLWQQLSEFDEYISSGKPTQMFNLINNSTDKES